MWNCPRVLNWIVTTKPDRTNPTSDWAIEHHGTARRAAIGSARPWAPEARQDLRLGDPRPMRRRGVVTPTRARAVGRTCDRAPENVHHISGAAPDTNH